MDDTGGLLNGLSQGLRNGMDAYSRERDRMDLINQKKSELEMQQKARDDEAVRQQQQMQFQEKQFGAGLLEKGVKENPTGGFMEDPTTMASQEKSGKLGLLKSEMAKNYAEADKAKKTKTDGSLAAATELRKEFQARPITKDFDVIGSAYKKIEAAANNPSGAGDMSLVYGMMKMQDPNSSVREGEYANAQNTGGADSKLANIYNKLKDGEFLTEAQRKDFLNQAQLIYKAQASQMGTVEDEFKGLAGKYEADPSMIYTPRAQGILTPPPVDPDAQKYSQMHKIPLDQAAAIIAKRKGQ